jgi:UDP-N-acetylglucosamine 2-epimerase (non-hydrolysing)
VERFGIEHGQFVLMTMHRPSNVDNPKILEGLLEAIDHIQKRLPVVFPTHPRTLKMIEQFGYKDRVAVMKNLKVTGPLDYHQTLCLNYNSKLVVTDSGGLQEETTALGIPCVTIRENTERPVTVSVGSNEVVGTDPEKIINAFERVMAGNWKKGGIPEGWDGYASKRIVSFLEKKMT